jgi:Flp pilus assembly protein CpaB
MMRPGDRVDVLVNYQVPNMRGRPTSKTATLLKYIEVFGTDNKTVSDGATKQQEVKTKVVSLVLDPNQVQIIMLAQSKGSLGLSWRHPDDDEDTQGGAVDESLLAELKGLDKMDEQQPPLHAESDREPANEDVAENTPKKDLTNLLDDGDSEPAQPAPVAVVAPKKPSWKVQIYQEDVPVEQEFELPETAPAASTDGTKGSNTLTDAFRWLHDSVTDGAAPAKAPAATETSL